MDSQKKYLSLARRYRPQIFQEVLGQEVIVIILKNALRFHRVAPSYLFAGSRGTGKTTLARILAKALNCDALSSNQEPCNRCKSCEEISSSRSLDVIEIDGASHRGIDDIRQINENAAYTPASGKYKIYLIDEVHMLTKEAFNALLKTLEEPPPSVKFFFATTEPHKVPTTILSRCQRFDLQRIPHTFLVQKLLKISQEQNRTIEEEALHLIARFSEGSLRDGETLLDMLFCYEEGKISIEGVQKALGWVSQNDFFALDLAREKGDFSFAFTLANSLFQSGKDLSHFMERLLEHFRNLLLIKKDKEMKHLEILSAFLKKSYEKSSLLYSEEELFYLLDFLLKASQTLQKSPSKQVTLEMILLHILRSKEYLSLPNLLHRLLALEKTLEKGAEKKKVSSTEVESLPTQENLYLPPKEATPFQEPSIPTPVSEKASLEKKSQSHYDTLIQFAAVELEGTIKRKL